MGHEGYIALIGTILAGLITWFNSKDSVYYQSDANCQLCIMLFVELKVISINTRLQEMISVSIATFQPFLMFFFPFVAKLKKLQSDPHFGPF